MYRIRIDDVDCSYEACGHCNQMPSEGDIRAAIEKSKAEMRRVCGVCGMGPIVQKLDLYHYKDGDQDRWCSRATELSPMLIFEDRSGLTIIQVPVHAECAMKAMPNVKWGFSKVTA
jgi:hypothetical protein